jgi:hypothetical protein
METILEAHDECPALAGREANPIVTTEGDVHPSADERSVAVCLSPCVPGFGPSFVCEMCGTARDIVGLMHGLISSQCPVLK